MMNGKVATDLQRQQWATSAPGLNAARETLRQPMTKETQIRFAAIVFGLLTVTAVVFAWINFQKEYEFSTPTDGVWWVESQGQLVARRVNPLGPGDRGGIKADDVLVSVGGNAVHNNADVARQMYRSGVWTKLSYTLNRDSVSLDVPVILQPVDKSLNQGLRLIALVYLCIGLYVLLRRWTAPKAGHFYLFCLVSFIFYSFKFTGKLNQFDWTIYWSNVVAGMLQPAMFLHFSLSFPERKSFVQNRSWILPLVYLPGLLLLSLWVLLVTAAEPSGMLLWNLDRMQMGYVAALFLTATIVLWHTYLRARSPILRQQMKWVTRGTFLAVVPFTVFYVVPFLYGQGPTAAMRISVLSLVFLPLTFGYAIVRYRLMDVDLIFKRGMAYTIAAGTIAAVYFAAVGATAELFHQNFPSTGPGGLVAAIVVTSVLFDPIKNWTQERIDKFFYRKRYDYRKTLIEFGRELNSERDLGKMLEAILERIQRTLLVDRMAVFLADVDSPGFVLAKSSGIAQTGWLDLRFLSSERPEFAEGHLFFDNTHQAVREEPLAQESIRTLDLNYYIPCTVMNRTIAMLGLGKTSDGDFLSSEDVELLETLAGYIGIALQNARLYASLEEKAQEYERLKEFNENIVESINVGVFAVDLQDKIESWNSQMEVMYALPRADAIGKSILDVLPPAFVEEFFRVRDNPGIHNLYKFRLGTTAGDTRVVNVAIAPLISKDFSVVGRLVIVDDITERIDLEAQLAQADKMSSIGLLAAGVAHEVNTPLAVISSYAQLLAKQLQGDEKRSELLDKITKQTFRASEIVNNLLNFSRTSGTEFGSVDLNRIIHDTLALLEHQFKTARILVVGELQPALPRIHGNQGKLQQVFLNLFLNAKDAMPHGGTLTVRTAHDHGVRVHVIDTGTGIAPEHIHRIYDPFFTTKGRPKQGGSGGTGLGLAVTYGIIQEHAGKIRVESSPGIGTSFYMEFPMSRKAIHV
jgi:two-component system, NtrC family, sensor kinase